MQKQLRFITIFLIFLGLSNLAFAGTSPIPKLEATANKILSQLRAQEASLKTNPKIAYNLVVKYLIPLVDQQYMAQSVLGRTAWNNASGAQRQLFIKEFRLLVVRTYAAAIAQFSDEQVEFLPLRGEASGSQLIVNTLIKHAGRPDIHVDYRLDARNSSWQIVDFSVDGISMIQSFRSQFAGQYSQVGMNGLIAKLQAHNQGNQ